jgi:transposase-like protein
MANLIDVAREFGTEEQCLAYLEAARWPSGLACLKCGSVKVAKTISTVRNRKTGQVSKTRHLYDCLEPECGFQFSATTGTIFHDSHLPLTKWFLAIALMCDAKKSVSALQLQRSLGIGSYRTAWYLAHRIRAAMEQDGGMFSGSVEADEMFVGGRYDKRRKRAPHDKQAVAGVLQRGTADRSSKVKAFPIPTPSKMILTGVIRDNVSTDADLLCTDEWRGYKAVGREYKRHEVINHIKLEYARRSGNDLITTNGIENFWSLFKRGLVGQFHSVSVKHLRRYLDEFTFRFNNRDSADLFNLTVTRMLAAIGLPYKELVSE